MADEGQAGPAVAEPEGQPAPEATPATPTVFVDGEGNLGDGWREHLPEDIRYEASLNDYKNVAGMAKSLVHAQRAIGKGKVAVPDENSTEGEWEEFHRAAGRPETAGDYNITRPDSLPEEYFDTELANGYQELFHKIGISAKQAEALVGFNIENTLAAIGKQQATNEDDRQAAMKALTEKHGSMAYEGRLELSKKALDMGAAGDEELRSVIAERYGNDADFVNWAANIGTHFGEARAVEATQAATLGSKEEELRELMQDPAYGNMQHINHTNVHARAMRLAEEIAAARPPE